MIWCLFLKMGRKLLFMLFLSNTLLKTILLPKALLPLRQVTMVVAPDRITLHIRDATIWFLRTTMELLGGGNIQTSGPSFISPKLNLMMLPFPGGRCCWAACWLALQQGVGEGGIPISRLWQRTIKPQEQRTVALLWVMCFSTTAIQKSTH